VPVIRVQEEVVVSYQQGNNHNQYYFIYDCSGTVFIVIIH